MFDKNEANERGSMLQQTEHLMFFTSKQQLFELLLSIILLREGGKGMNVYAWLSNSSQLTALFQFAQKR